MSLLPRPSDAELVRLAEERAGIRKWAARAAAANWTVSPSVADMELDPATDGQIDAPSAKASPRGRRGQGRAPKAPVPTEHEEQVALFAWIDGTRDTLGWRHSVPEAGFIAAVPNGGFRTPASAGRAKAEGQRPGYPDIMWDLPRGRFGGFRGELKRVGSGQLSPLQSEWHVYLERCGLYVTTVHGWEAMRDDLLAYYDLPCREYHR